MKRKTKTKAVFEFFGKMGKAFRRKSAQERADELGCRIRAAIDAGKFELSYGYLGSPGSLAYPNGLYDGLQQAKKFSVCHGCAVAAAAFACGLQTAAEQDGCQRKVVEHDLMSSTEAAQLEMGYENSGFDLTWMGRGVKRNTASPFYQLGKKMAIASKHRRAKDYPV